MNNSEVKSWERMEDFHLPIPGQNSVEWSLWFLCPQKGYIILGEQQYPEWIFIHFWFISGWSVLEYLGGQCESHRIKESPWGRENNTGGRVKDPAGTFRAVVVISNPGYTAATGLPPSLIESQWRAIIRKKIFEEYDKASPCQVALPTGFLTHPQMSDR